MQTTHYQLDIFIFSCKSKSKLHLISWGFYMMKHKVVGKCEVK